MYRQFEFDFGLPAPPRRPARPERLFFCVLLQRSDSARFGQARQEICLAQCVEGSLIKPDRLHVSLHHIGDYKRLIEKYVFAACRAANAVSMPPFDITFRRVASFSGRSHGDGPPRRPLVLLADPGPVAELHRLLGLALGENGLRRATGFQPHLTLLYGRKLVPEQPIERIGFQATEFALVHSRLWLGEYDVLGRWNLRD